MHGGGLPGPSGGQRCLNTEPPVLRPQQGLLGQYLLFKADGARKTPPAQGPEGTCRASANPPISPLRWLRLSGTTACPTAVPRPGSSAMLPVDLAVSVLCLPNLPAGLDRPQSQYSVLLTDGKFLPASHLTPQSRAVCFLLWVQRAEAEQLCWQGTGPHFGLQFCSPAWPDYSRTL